MPSRLQFLLLFAAASLQLISADFVFGRPSPSPKCYPPSSHPGYTSLNCGTPFGLPGATKVTASSCRASCANGYFLTSSGFSATCPSEGGTFSFEGCQPGCYEPASHPMYKLLSDCGTPSSKKKSCTIGCAAGYYPTVEGPKATCTAGQPFTFTGCEEGCYAPATEGYDPTTCGTQASPVAKSRCQVSCDSGYVQTSTPTATCSTSSNVATPFSFSGCGMRKLAEIFPLVANGENGVVCQARDPDTGALEPMTNQIHFYPAGDWTVQTAYRKFKHGGSYAFLLVSKVNDNTIGTHPAGSDHPPIRDACVNLNLWTISRIKGSVRNQGSGSIQVYILVGGAKAWQQNLGASAGPFSFDKNIPSNDANTVMLCANSLGDDGVDHPEWIDVEFVGTRQTTTVTMTVDADIDGNDVLHIKSQTNQIWWEHVTGSVKPTHVDVGGHAWGSINWPSGQTTSSPKNLFSEFGFRLGDDWPIMLTEYGLDLGYERGHAADFKTPYPGNSNGWELQVEINDEGDSGVFRRKLALVFVTQTCGVHLPDYCPFPMNVRDTINWDFTYCTSVNDCKAKCCEAPRGKACLKQLSGWKHDDLAPLRSPLEPDAGTCCQSCQDHPDCKFWSYNDDTEQCFHHAAANLAPAGHGWSCSTYQDAPPASDACGDMLPGWQYVGIGSIYDEGIPQDDPKLCCQLCKETQGCVHWTWKPERFGGGNCFLHNQDATLDNMNNDNRGGYCSYSEPLVDTSKCGALLLYGWAHSSRIIYQQEVPSLNSCCELCQTHPGCHYLDFLPGWSEPRERDVFDPPVGVCRLHAVPHLIQHVHGAVTTYPAPDVLPSECAPIVNDWRYVGQELGDMDAPKASSCCAYCADTAGCIYWTWTPSNKKCHIFASVTHTKPLKGAVSGAYTRAQSGIGSHTPRRCEGRWIEVDGTCSMPCGTGKKREMYHVSSPAKYGGENCEAQHGTDRWVDCNRKPCGRDCVGKWIGHEGCSHACGWGTTTLRYHVLWRAAEGGHQCEHHDGKRISKPCYVRRCGPGESTSEIGPEIPVERPHYHHSQPYEREHSYTEEQHQHIVITKRESEIEREYRAAHP